ncbi:hypothetical protein H4Q26_017065 [Puccinia striiformis f. sp. tritici PST-130]|nr:hypothetical protein H4Q26_017065 [Puccinia striiformis f. sp. tritici PST-130]
MGRGGIGFKEPGQAQLITLPQRDLILKLTELGWLYKKIEGAIPIITTSSTVQQAFGFALKEELSSYYRAIAIIQSHLSSDPSSTLTSKALLLHLTPTVLRLRMSAALISATKDFRGGQMISILHSYTDHGDPVVNLFTSNLLEKVSIMNGTKHGRKIYTTETNSTNLHYKDINGLQQTIESTYSIATNRLFQIFFIKLRLLDHFKAVKDYLLLGRGDFISILIESLGPSLNKPANRLYRHNLTATLESAIRATTEKIIGNVVLSTNAMEKYMRMFRVLWKLKRLEYNLDRAWKVVILGVNRSLKHLHCLRDDFHRARLVISEMIHFIRQLQSWEWGGDLDSLIENHSVYLDRLVNKGLLLSNRVGKENTCLLLAEDCFKVILAFKDSIDNLYAFGLSKSARLLSNHQQQSESRHNRRTKYGKMEDSDEEHEQDEDDDDDEDEDEDGEESRNSTAQIQLESIRIQISNHSKRFTELVLDLISALSTQQDSDMKFLAVRLNFSFYMRTTKSSSSTITTTTTATTGQGGSHHLHHHPQLYLARLDLASS